MKIESAGAKIVSIKYRLVWAGQSHITLEREMACDREGPLRAMIRAGTEGALPDALCLIASQQKQRGAFAASDVRNNNILLSYGVLLKEINIVKHSYAMLIKALEKLMRKSAIVSSKCFDKVGTDRGNINYHKVCQDGSEMFFGSAEVGFFRILCSRQSLIFLGWKAVNWGRVKGYGSEEKEFVDSRFSSS
ncbi:hypothetical protein llap_7742 [Limosa lapponica baueri]|uniref:Uncharacterized protein n=1 Tax=Limosa lapponica baueri TaxID=1758121 RepID=A0A2I0U7K9_LIMLA|nr:hypothetical protein llap_7742 [Limosa lapponica baueri]